MRGGDTVPLSGGEVRSSGYVSGKRETNVDVPFVVGCREPDGES